MPVAKPEIVVLNVEPAMAPGLRVQLPAGNPLNSTLPVDTEQVGCVMVPTTGVIGVTGWASIVAIFPEDIQPSEFIAVTVYVPTGIRLNIPVELV